MIHAPTFDQTLWIKKAQAFVTRSHRHLWGKNNEGPQAFLFIHGLKNSFVKQQIIGWNKFGQERPAQNWGGKTAIGSNEKLFLPSGIVVPLIKKKQLQSVFIHPYKETPQITKTTILPGSLSPTLVLGENKDKIILLQNLIDGLFLFQEQSLNTCVMIHPDMDIPLDPNLKITIKKAKQIVICASNETQDQENRKNFSHAPDSSFFLYSSKEELIKIIH